MTASDLQPETMPELFYGSEERLKWDDDLTAGLCRSRYRNVGRRVRPSLDNEQFRQKSAGFDFCSTRPLAELLPWIIARLEQGIVQLTHPRYFALFNPAPTFPPGGAECIVATFNPQLASAVTSPIPPEIEAHGIRSVAGRPAFPQRATGHCRTGGTDANQTASVCALTKANPAYADDGMHAFRKGPAIYVSEEVHLAWLKLAHQVGLDHSAVRVVAADDQGRKEVTALVATIEADRSTGCASIVIVGTAGTTGAGMIDPFARIAA